jgi:thymidylate kinase
MHDRGIMIALLGPDGCGKSSVIAGLTEDWTANGRTVTTMHFRPRLDQRGSATNDTTVTDPHGQPPRGTVASAAKLAFYLMDYLLGHPVVVRPRIRNGEIVLADRYFPDLLVDPRRYRYGGPTWLPRMVWRIIPKPDAILLLDASPEVVRKRKLEVTFAETARQQAAYRALVATLPNGYIIDASRPLDEVVATASAVISGCVAQRSGWRPEPVGRS